MKVHFLGIGGVGMAGLAVLLKARGHAVSGCDLHDSPRTHWLRGLGIPVAIGHDAAHVADADEVIVTPAVHPDNPEFRAARRVRYRGEVLADLVSETDSIAVCGSHGKTTTATFTAKLLRALGEPVAWAIGGETGSFPVAGVPATLRGDATLVASAHPSPVLVVEADESDGTLARYHARTLVVTNCEYDHPDHFPTPEAYRACFDQARRQAKDVIEASELALADWPIPLAAEHNRRNARAAIEVALRRGHSREAILRVLPEVVSALPDRRFQRLAEGVYTDYAHHPTEMRCAVEMARAAAKGCLRVLFQPHRYSRTKALLHDFAKAFPGADEVILLPTYAAFEQPIPGGDIADLYKALRETPHAYRLMLARSVDEAWTHARLSAQPGDLTLLLGAGDLIAVADHPVLPPKRIPIGMGTNTWRSELRTNETYFTVDAPAGRPGATLGIPWMAGIPGTIGGWVKMNAGAFGHSISEVLEAVKVDGRWLPAAACGFGYRTSGITGVIEDIRLQCTPTLPGDATSVASAPPSTSTASDYLARRRHFPAGTKGSVFRNPPGDFAGRLLEAAGAKDLRVGGAYVWQEHANVIVSGPDAVPSDFLALARLMYLAVLDRFGLALEPEVRGLR